MRHQSAIVMVLATAARCAAGFPRLVECIECRCVLHFRIRPIKGHDIDFPPAKRLPFVRGGHMTNADLIESDRPETLLRTESLDINNQKRRSTKLGKPRKARHTSDVVRNILERKETMSDEEVALREQIDRRANEYVEELRQSTSADTAIENKKPSSPLKVLHYLSPKVPAIKLSPDFMLRIQTARGDLDAGIAATIISTMAQLSIHYEKRTGQTNTMSKEICNDRRFEQLVECVLCGVDVWRRMQESMTLGEVDSAMQIDIETLLDEENVKIQEGLSVPDACRAAWGIAMLIGYGQASFGGQNVIDVLTALSLRTRERLLARLQLLRQGELRSYTSSEMSLTEGFDKDTKDLAEDVASAIWTFACVKAATGLRTVPLFEASCSLLCQNPMQLRIREQAKKLGLNGNDDFDVEEVVDKLAKAENGTSDEFRQSEATGVDKDDEKDVLLHWLSPNEVAGIMWAVALHGRSHDVGAKGEMKLSETATALSEIAFDCISDWLSEDLIKHREAKPIQDNLSNDRIDRVCTDDQELVHQLNGVVVEVVDAATILAEESAQAMSETVVKNVNLTKTSMADGDLITESEKVEIFNPDSSTEPLEKDGQVEPPEILKASIPIARENSTRLDSQSIFLPSHRAHPELHFTNHKLCSIVWASTDLQDSLRNLLLDTTLEIFVEQGSQSMSELGGGDLANLAWAIARRSLSNDFLPGNEVSTRMKRLLEWIAERSLQLLEAQKGEKLLDEFQAPELGRLMWSLSMAHLNLSDQVGEHAVPGKSFRQLGLLSLNLSDVFSSRFGSEDLARICWAFLELSVLDDVFRDPTVPATLGRLVSLMESSVLRWENGQCEKSAKEATRQVDESIRFTSFFGKPRLALRLLEQRLEAGIDDDDESQVADIEKTRQLPLLRDLSFDPSTMCKLAYALSRAQEFMPEIDGAWTFTRVAVRLMCSKHGHLLRMSSIGDNVRLAYACVINQANGRGREFVSRLYVPRLVHLLNEQLNGVEVGTLSNRLALSPDDTATIVWALGYLGVRHWTPEQAVDGVAHKKVRLVTSLPLLSESQLQSSSPSLIVRLLHGAVSMEMLSTAPRNVLPLLLALESKSHDEFAKADQCELTECLGRIISITRAASENTASHSEDADAAFEDKNSTGIFVNEEKSDALMTARSLTSTIVASSNKLLQTVTLTTLSSLKSMTAKQIRRILTTFSVLPFQADALINAIDIEINYRLNATKYVTNLPESAIRAAAAARGSLDALADQSDEGRSRLSSLRNGLRSIFVQSPDGDEINDDDEDTLKLEAVADLLNETASTANLVTDHFSRVSILTNKDPALLLSAEQHGSVFELSRCLELIASYRLVNFGTGRRQSRQDDGRIKGIGHQVISRIFY